MVIYTAPITLSITFEPQIVDLFLGSIIKKKKPKESTSSVGGLLLNLCENANSLQSFCLFWFYCDNNLNHFKKD